LLFACIASPYPPLGLIYGIIIDFILFTLLERPKTKGIYLDIGKIGTISPGEDS